MKRDNRNKKTAAANAHDKDAAKSSDRAPIIPTRRRWLFRLAAMTLIPLLVFGGLEVGLRLANYGYNPNFFVPLRIGGEDFLVQNEEFSRRFFPGDVSRQPSALRMKANKPKDSLRIFVLGESAAMGDPEPAYGPARHMETLLRLRYPQKQIEVVNVAYTAINSHVILPIARACAAQDGDLWMIYIGNNEMVGPFGAATVFGAQSPPRNYVRLSLALQRTRVGQLCRAVAARFQKPATANQSWGGMQMFMENQVAPDSPKRMAAYENFAGNLDDIVALGLDSGARVVLNTMAVNLADSPPFASQAPTINRREFEAAINAGFGAMTNRNWSAGVEQLTKAIELNPASAVAHFYQAICLRQAGDDARAQKHFQLACDLDALPFRADTHINEAIRATAARHQGGKLELLEAPAAIAQLSGTSPCGEETFYEHVHFNFDGSYRLGLAWARAAERSLTNSLGQPAGDWATQDASERALGLTDWNRKLVLASVVQRLQQPPLNYQPNNPARVARLQMREQQLLAGMNRETLALANSVYVTALAARPDDHFLHEVYGNFLQVSGDIFGATHEWQRTAELMPHDFLPWFQLGVLQARQNQHAQAGENFRHALRLRPGLVEGWIELGRSLTAAGKHEAALEAFDHAQKLRPQDPFLHASRGNALAELGRKIEAIDAFAKAVELYPGYGEARTALGDLLAREGRVDAAIGQFQRALELNPSNVIAAEQLRRLQSSPPYRTNVR